MTEFLSTGTLPDEYQQLAKTDVQLVAGEQKRVQQVIDRSRELRVTQQRSVNAEASHRLPNTALSGNGLRLVD